MSLCRYDALSLLIGVSREPSKGMGDHAMNNRKALIALAAAALLIVLAGCGSMSDIYGNNRSTSNDIRGTVSSIDPNTRSIWLTNTSGYNSMLSSSGSGGGDVRVYYDNNTRVTYNGQSYRPEDLDRGDQIDVRVTQSGNRLMADTVDVTYNSATTSSQSRYPSSGSVNAPYNQTITGTVRSVDTSRRQIQLDRGYGSTTWVDYDTNTMVSFNGRNSMPQDLQSGDQVTISAIDSGGGRLLAQNVSVNRSISSGGTTQSSSYATVRGTVRSVDTGSRTIQLDQTSWTSGFVGDNSGYLTVQYNSNANVDISGQLYPVTGLERGDVVEVQVQNLGNANWLANRITLIRNVRQ